MPNTPFVGPPTSGYFKPLASVAKDYRDWAVNARRIGIGYSFFDERTLGGVATGELLLLWARSQVGKTTLALNFINNLPDVATIFFSLEMHGRYLIPRLAGMHTNTATSEIELRLRQGLTHPAVDQTVVDFPKLAIVDASAMSLKKMREAIKEVSQKMQCKIERIVIDYSELIGGTPALDSVNHVEKITWGVKEIAKDFDLAAALMQQVGRSEGGAGALPLTLRSGKYGGEQSADYVLAAYRPALREGITQKEFEVDQWLIPLQFLKTRASGGIHPEGLTHFMHPETMKVAESMEEWFTQEQLLDAGYNL